MLRHPLFILYSARAEGTTWAVSDCIGGKKERKKNPHTSLLTHYITNSRSVQEPPPHPHQHHHPTPLPTAVQSSRTETFTFFFPTQQALVYQMVTCHVATHHLPPFIYLLANTNCHNCRRPCGGVRVVGEGRRRREPPPPPPFVSLRVTGNFAGVCSAER